MRQRNRKLKDYAGLRFGRLVAVRLIERDFQWNDHKWLFRCDCGNEKVVRLKSARTGHTSSCGCLAREVLVYRNETHGLTRTHPGAYRSWKDMRARCLNERGKDFKDYGGRGISICLRWDDFAEFVRDMGERPQGRSLDRIDVNGDYSPENCRWAVAETQANNKRSNQRIAFRGEEKTLQQWCRQFGLEHSKVRYRLANGYTLDEAFSSGDFRQ